MFEYELRKNGDRLVTARIRGALVLGRETESFRACLEVLIGHYQTILLDASQLQRIDSAGLGELVRAYAEGEARGCNVRLVGATEQISNLLVLTKLATVFWNEAPAA